MAGCDPSNQTGNSLMSSFAINVKKIVFLFLPPIYIDSYFNTSMLSSTEKVFVMVHVVVRIGNVLCTLFSSSRSIIFCRFQIWQQQFSCSFYHILNAI